MSLDLRSELAQLLDGYRDGTLAARDAQRLAALLDDPELAAQAMAMMADDGLIAMALEADGHALAAWRKRVALDADAAAFRHDFEVRRSSTEIPMHRSPPARPLWYLPRHRLTAAALILVTLGVAAWSTTGLWLPAPGAQLETADARTRLWLDGHSRPGQPGTLLKIGERVEQSGSGTTAIRFADGTRLNLSAGALVIERLEAGKRLRLERGRLAAQVEPQGSDRPLTIATAATETVVVGTAFTLEIDLLANSTHLTVDHGLVHYASLQSGQQAEVAAGQAAIVTGNGALGVQPLGAAPGAEKIRAFIDTHCAACHGEKKQKGKLRLDSAPTAINGRDFESIWSSALERLTSGEMPPPEEKLQPTQSERQQVSEWITEQLKLAEAQRLATTEKVSLRKLTREEYANTLRDLLGVAYEPADPGGLPEDPNWHGFERIGPVQTLSPAHLERYLAAAELVMDQVLPTGDVPKPISRRFGMQKLRGGPNDHDPFINSHARIDIAPNGSTNFKSGHSIWIERAGEYTLTLSVSGLRPPGGSAPHLYVYSASLDRVLLARDIDAAENQPEVVTVTTFLPAGEISFMIYNAVPGLDPYENAASGPGPRPFFTLKRERSPTQQKLTDDQYVPLVPILILDHLTFAGPLNRDQSARLVTSGKQDAAHARQIIAAFAERAFRRPVRADDLDRLTAVADRSLKRGASFIQAIKSACIAVLCAQDFISLVEGSADKPRATLDDWEIASRLSYFLWSSMPDNALFARARAGKLTQTVDLLAETRRLLADPKAERFIADFPRQWLHLRDVGKFPPNRTIFPLYDEPLERSLRMEPVAYFREMLQSNLPLREFIASDWAMVNGPLARLYGLTGVVDMTLRKVALKPEHHRGGVLTMGAVLSQTSDGSRQKPINRGKWVMENILGKSPPPPPPNAGDIPTTQAKQPKATVRQKIEAHRSNAACAACHAKIDPLGFAFDHYDGIGAWRTVETTAGTGDNPAVDASGTLPDGRRFADAAGLKQLLIADIDQFAEVFVEKLATYALRRPLGLSDRDALKTIVAKTKPGGHRLNDLIETLVQSDLFRKR